MKLSKIFALLFGLIGLALAAGSVWLGLTYRNASPQLISPSKEVRQTVDAMLSEVCSGDYAAASQRILGNPKFGMTYTPEDPAEEMVWNAFRNSFSYELVGDCVSTEAGLSMNAKISFLELDSVTDGLNLRVQQILEQRIAEAQDVKELYDENHEIKEAVVMEALQIAVRDSIAQNSRLKTVEVTVSLIWRDDQWWVLPDDGLLSALSGGIAK